MKSWYELKPERRYIIERITPIERETVEKVEKVERVERLEGIFVQLLSDYVLMRNMKRKSLPNVSHCGITFQCDIYYDIEEIRENARKSRESMEQRSLHLILKRLINEEFEW